MFDRIFHGADGKIIGDIARDEHGEDGVEARAARLFPHSLAAAMGARVSAATNRRRRRESRGD